MSNIFSDELIAKEYRPVGQTSEDQAKIRAKYELVVDLLAEVDDELKLLGLVNYWPARIGGYVSYALAEAREALEELE